MFAFPTHFRTQRGPKKAPAVTRIIHLTTSEGFFLIDQLILVFVVDKHSARLNIVIASALLEMFEAKASDIRDSFREK